MDLRLEKRDPATSQARFYRLITMPTLFGGWSLVREWGRIGHPGQVNVEPYATEDEAAVAGAKLAASKRRRGYEPPLMRMIEMALHEWTRQGAEQTGQKCSKRALTILPDQIDAN